MQAGSGSTGAAAELSSARHACIASSEIYGYEPSNQLASDSEQNKLTIVLVG